MRSSCENCRHWYGGLKDETFCKEAGHSTTRWSWCVCFSARYQPRNEEMYHFDPCRNAIAEACEVCGVPIYEI